jgi:hypothetical protein
MASTNSKAIPRIPIKPTTWVRDTPLGGVRNSIVNVGGIGAPNPVEKAKLDQIKKPMDLRAETVKLRVPESRSDARFVRAAIAAKGATAYFRDYPRLSEAVLHEVYERAGTTSIDDKARLGGAAEAVFEDLEPTLYGYKVKHLLEDAGVTLSDKKRESIVTRLMAAQVAYDSRKFQERVFGALTAINDEEKFNDIFEKTTAGAGPTVKDELGDLLTSSRRSQAIRVLRRLGLDPAMAKDDDWARIALAMIAREGADRDILAVAGFGPSSEDFEADYSVQLPEFDTAEVVGLIPENIRSCADLYYIHTFDRLGVYRAVDALSIRFFDHLNLGLSETAHRLYAYIKRRSDRIPAEDRRRLTTHLFEGDAEGHGPFKLLMGQMVEALIEYMRVRDAGELIVGSPSRPSLSGRRSAVLRSAENLQRYLSRAGGGMAIFLSREAGRQLVDCFQILESQELRSYFGGDFTEGMWGVIEQLVEEIDGKPGPPADRMRTMAVNGRRVIQWLADHADDVSTASDDELDDLADRVQNWLAAYRRPEIEEPEWLDDDEIDEEAEEEEGPGAEAVRDALADSEADMEADVLTEVS